MDLNMLVLRGGMERTLKQYGTILANAGLELQRGYQTVGPLGILEATPAPRSKPRASASARVRKPKRS